jgi:hypothetical protein
MNHVSSDGLYFLIRIYIPVYLSTAIYYCYFILLSLPHVIAFLTYIPTRLASLGLLGSCTRIPVSPLPNINITTLMLRGFSKSMMGWEIHDSNPGNQFGALGLGVDLHAAHSQCPQQRPYQNLPVSMNLPYK